MIPRTVTLIVSDELRGKGLPGDPYRRATILSTLDGRLIASYDPCDRPNGEVSDEIESLAR